MAQRGWTNVPAKGRKGRGNASSAFAVRPSANHAHLAFQLPDHRRPADAASVARLVDAVEQKVYGHFYATSSLAIRELV